jgi:DNA-binding transcriptional ArsR family regulator
LTTIQELATIQKDMNAIQSPEQTDEFVIGDLETLRALTDRQRLQIMEAFARHGGAPRTVKEVASDLGESPTKLYYHVNMLEQHGLLLVAESRIVSGIVEKRYTPSARRFRVDRELLSAASAGSTGLADQVGDAIGNVLDSAGDGLRAAIASGQFNPGDGKNLVTQGTMRLTAALAERVRALLKEIAEIEDSADDDAADYALTIAFHPSPGAPDQ